MKTQTTHKHHFPINSAYLMNQPACKKVIAVAYSGTLGQQCVCAPYPKRAPDSPSQCKSTGLPDTSATGNPKKAAQRTSGLCGIMRLQWKARQFK